MPTVHMFSEPVFDRLDAAEQEAIIEVVAECLLAQVLEDLAKKSEPTHTPSQPRPPTPLHLVR